MSDNGNNDSCLECSRVPLRLMEVTLGAIVENKDILQALVEEVRSLLDADRCVYFKIFYDGAKNEYACRRVAGVPIDGHEVMLKNDSLANHRDLNKVFAEKEILHVKDPLTNELTAYFKDAVIVPKGINQILYIPVIVGKEVEIVRGIIVIDSVGQKVFSEQNVAQCPCIGKAISLTANREDFLHQRWRDRILNHTVSLGAYAKKIKAAADVISDAVEKVEKQFEEDRKNTFI